MTETERLLLDSLKNLTRESGEREQRLIEAFESREKRLIEDFESRVKLLNQESAEREQRLIEDFESRMQHFLEHLKLLNKTYEAFEKRLVALENRK